MTKRKTTSAIITLNCNVKNTQIGISQLISVREFRHKKNTRGVNHALIKQLFAFCGHDPCIRDITETFCVDFSKFLTRRVTLNSTRTYLQKLLAVMEYAVSQHLITKNPMPSIIDLLPRFNSPQRTYLSLEEINALKNAQCRHSETKRAFLFACLTGLRLSDIETLRWNDIVNIDDVPTIVKSQVKTGHEVRIPLNPIAIQLLGSKQDDVLVFKLMSRSIISSDLKEWASKAGLSKRLTFHVSRHTFATLSISAGVDIYVVSKLCGHTNVRTTEIYAHMIDKTLQKGVYMLGDAMMKGDFNPIKNIKTKMYRIVKSVIGYLFYSPKKLLNYS
ncbi:MAG: site-specific integrase [Bacteroidales bacterium]|nr:site-specific integrase [Bacteroidales bacterium]